MSPRTSLAEKIYGERNADDRVNIKGLWEVIDTFPSRERAVMHALFDEKGQRREETKASIEERFYQPGEVTVATLQDRVYRTLRNPRVRVLYEPGFRMRGGEVVGEYATTLPKLAKAVSERTGKNAEEITHLDFTEAESNQWHAMMAEQWREEKSLFATVTVYFMLQRGDDYEEFSQAEMRRLPRIGEGISLHDGDEGEVSGRIRDIIWTIDQRPFSISPVVAVVIEEDDLGESDK